MSSNEVIKHSRKIFGIVKNKSSNFKHKFWEIFGEILIIVFAISFSLLLERWRQKAEDRTLEKHFLVGLKTDLLSDLTELKAASAKAISMKQGAKYFLKPESEISWSADSVKFYAAKLFHNIYFFPNANRYESLKSTGKLDVIENEVLQNDIINLYQTQFPDLAEQINFFNSFVNGDVINYLIHNLKMDANNQLIFDKTFFSNSELKNILILYGDLDDVLKRLNNTISAGEKISGEMTEP